MTNAVSADIATIGRINVVPAILQVICETTGMRFAAVARVTEDSWTACAVLDNLGFGLKAGDELDVASTLCHEIRSSQQTIVIDKASEDEQYCRHHTPRIYRFESYISVPVLRADGRFFGTLCALDPEPAQLKGSAIQPMMESFARLLSIQIESEENAQRTERALQKERAMAEVREQFIAVLGHDLRNPLFAITAGAELLAQRLQDDKSRAIARHILTSGRRASQLVRDVLDFARGRLGAGIPLNQQPCPDLREALGHVASELQRVHPQRRILLDIADIGGLRCDRERVAQLLSNLIANALTHGAPDGPVTVSAAIRDGTFVLSVHNLGEPIPAQTLAQLFQPFSRPLSDAPQQGLGLGLYIANQIALAHGGYMDVASSAQAGTLFSFRLPVDRPETPAAPPASP
ncbi:GAF domain-containing sensor histidine kinase [Pseudomonas guariconensis]|uniref:GAF domain-containing sensor histidine kinase n=1 Tax=Pseudomonas TaxID=286 RepID=UPI001CE3C4DA|nr:MULTISPECIES: GAF domain-containing sensor histidine kinase [Pseudomonas]MCO7637221.1 GAF domain-containing sensor histidine kinase [Pseudomonas sp. S 311-6]MCO7517657.1 GAF domain-containing sensor histidine kinase [Pseudomonas putida]MCO7567948.1 GAF domain-containing sensor histidine kinase [Pseudomonas mosselii]MCO7596850.1 GAF domain-containing sensor histidine kinase [Pseudomonas guariconensis]MCO7608131.1 GAF domain-containing sensor histidine kinase [Pseudomonas guariconensis]